MEAAGIVGPFEGSKARQVLIPDLASLEQLIENDGIYMKKTMQLYFHLLLSFKCTRVQTLSCKNLLDEVSKNDNATRILRFDFHMS